MKSLILITSMCGLLGAVAMAQTSSTQQNQQAQNSQQQSQQGGQQSQNPLQQGQTQQQQSKPVKIRPVRVGKTPTRIRPTKVAPPKTKTIKTPIGVKRTTVGVPYSVPNRTIPLQHQNYLSRFEPGTPDLDGDGQRAVQDIDAILGGGRDCDDKNPNRYVNNTEVADFQGNDEDCDPSTIGKMDRDGDGYTDWRVWNAPFQPTGWAVYGLDCDDRRRGVNPGVPEIPGNGLDDNCDGDVDYDDSWPSRSK